mgnify:CR=1 FL=1
MIGAGERLTELLQRSGLGNAHLLVEVTEGSLLDQPEHVREVLEQMRHDLRRNPATTIVLQCANASEL